jgi:hypothetical protein
MVSAEDQHPQQQPGVSGALNRLHQLLFTQLSLQHLQGSWLEKFTDACCCRVCDMNVHLPSSCSAGTVQDGWHRRRSMWKWPACCCRAARTPTAQAAAASPQGTASCGRRRWSAPYRQLRWPCASSSRSSCRVRQVDDVRAPFRDGTLRHPSQGVHMQLQYNTTFHDKCITSWPPDVPCRLWQEHHHQRAGGGDGQRRHGAHHAGRPDGCEEPAGRLRVHRHARRVPVAAGAADAGALVSCVSSSLRVVSSPLDG